MLRSVAIARIQRGLGFRTDLSDTIVLALQEAQRDLEGGKSFPWFLIEEDASFAVPAGTAAVAQPTDFLGQVEDDGFHYTNSEEDIIFLSKKPYDEATAYYAESEPGSPLAYSLRKNSFSFFPERDTSYTLTWSYYKRGTLLDADITNSWLTACPELLIGMAGTLVAADLEHQAATQKFAAMYTRWDEWLTKEMARREEENMPRAMGRNR